MPAAASSAATSSPSGMSLRALTELALDGVEHVVRGPGPFLGIAPVPLLEIRVVIRQPLSHRALVDLLLVPVRQLPFHFGAVVAHRFDHGRHVLPVENLHACHERRCTNWKPQPPLLQRLPRLTSGSSVAVTSA